MKFKNIIIFILIGLFLVGCKTEYTLDRYGNFINKLKSSHDKPYDDNIQELVHKANKCYDSIKNNSKFHVEEKLLKYTYSLEIKGNIKDLPPSCIREVREGVYLIGYRDKMYLPSNAYKVYKDDMYIEPFEHEFIIEGSGFSSSIDPDLFIFSLNNKELNTYLQNNGLMKKSDKIDSVNRKYRSLIKGLALEYDGNIEEYKSSVTIYDQYIGVKNWSKESKKSIENFKTKYSKFLNARRKSRLSSLSYDLSKIYETSKDMLYLVSKYHAKEIPSLAKDDYSFSDFALSSLNTVATLSKRKKLHEKSIDEINEYKNNLLKGY